MSALATFDQATRQLGISKPALVSAIERGDLTQVELEGLRGAIRKYVTQSSIDAWVDRMNGREPVSEDSNSDLAELLLTKVSQLRFHLNNLEGKLDAAIGKMGKMGSHQEAARRIRLRNTVSSRIGDSFDPHGFYVYLLWGDDDQTPIYIGQSRNVLSRLGSHMTNGDRRYLVRTVQLIKCNGMTTMNRTEAALIREYQPPLNVVGVVRGVAR